MVLDLDFYRGPGRRQKLTAGAAAVIIALILIMGGIIGFSLYLTAYSRTTVIRLDPYLKVSIRGADSFARVSAEFDRDSFAERLEKILSQNHPGEEMTAEELRKLADTAAASVHTDYILERRRQETTDGPKTQVEYGTERISGTGLSNGDRIYCYAYMGEEAQALLREKGFVLAFESDRILQTAEGLPEAEPYDPFSDLKVEFEGRSGNGRVILTYKGEYPLTFQAEPAQKLSNGDTVRICMTPAEKYDFEQMVGEYHIVPTASEASFEVSGLFFEPASIHSFSEVMLNSLKEHGREKARALLEEEYFQDEKLVSLEDAGLFFAVRPEEACSVPANDEEGKKDLYGNNEFDTGRETKDNYLYCAYLVHYADETGNQLEYYYYVRFENLLINDQDQIYADFDQTAVPQKTTLLWRGLFGEDSAVSVPGFLNFRTLAGFETLQGLQDAITAALDDGGYGITQMI